MEYDTIEYNDLSDAQMDEMEAKTNDTLPQGQSFFLDEKGKIVAIENSLLELFEAQNRDALESGDIRKIV